MAAVLVRNKSEGSSTVLPDGLNGSNLTACVEGCPITYSLTYEAVEDRIEKGLNIAEVLATRATEIVHAAHPGHDVKTYVWAGKQHGWLTREEATAVGV